MTGKTASEIDAESRVNGLVEAQIAWATWVFNSIKEATASGNYERARALSDALEVSSAANKQAAASMNLVRTPESDAAAAETFKRVTGKNPPA